MGVNAIPLGNHDTIEVPAPTSRPIAGAHGEFADLTMASLSNKNKKRGFKNAVGKEVPSKIIFSRQASPDTNVNGRVEARTPRLIPPSEKREKGLLPPNVLVTSVNVEEGLRQNRKPKPVIPNTQRSETPPVGRTAEELDRAVINAKWDSLELVASAAGLPTGTTVGWKVRPIPSLA